MLTWFIVAIVTLANGEMALQKMQKPFATKELCQQFYLKDFAVRDDVMILFPNQQGHTLVCLTKSQILELKGQTSI